MRFLAAAVVELYNMIGRGGIGEVKWVRANFSFCRPPDPTVERLTESKLRGGALLDVCRLLNDLSKSI